MGYGDIIKSRQLKNETYRERNGVETISRAVVLKDASTKGSAAINHTSDSANLAQLTTVRAYNKAGLYIGTTGDVLVLLSDQSDIIAEGTATTDTANKLIDSDANFTSDISNGDHFVQKRDVVLNKDTGNIAFAGAVANATTINLVNISNTAVDTFPDGDEGYEIYRAVLFQNIPAGTILPVVVDRVFNTGTTADDIIALY